MEKIILNNEMNLHLPEGFHVLSEEELRQYPAAEETPDWGASNPEQHILTVISWRKRNGFLSALAGLKELSKTMEDRMRKIMQPYGYQLESFVSRRIGGLEAEGFRYDYTAQETAMSAESLIAKKGKNFYYIHSYYHTALKEESLSTLENLFGSAGWEE